jgi:hypothetical protein
MNSRYRHLAVEPSARQALLASRHGPSLTTSFTPPKKKTLQPAVEKPSKKNGAFGLRHYGQNPIILTVDFAPQASRKKPPPGASP